jgi:3-hydroxyacyl-[acyl-carrier-protein] dehydratase
MHFTLIDRILERSADHAVATKAVTNAEEYLLDHFPGFPILPGVMMLEAMTQAARAVLEPDPTHATGMPWVLGTVRALKYGRMVRPGDTLLVRVDVAKREPDGSVEFRASGHVRGPDGVLDESAAACAGKITLRRARLSLPNAMR